MLIDPVGYNFIVFLRKCSEGLMPRFITKAKSNSYKIYITGPDGKVYNRTVGFTKIGSEAGLQKALTKRENLGLELWGEFWPALVSDPNYLYRLPRTMEPYLHQETDFFGDTSYQYRASWTVIGDDGSKITHELKRRISKKRDSKQAYAEAKAALLEAHEDILPVLRYMKAHGHPRFENVDLG